MRENDRAADDLIGVLGSTPRLIAASTVSSNFFVAVCFTRLIASSSLYRFTRSTFSAAALNFFAT